MESLSASLSENNIATNSQACPTCKGQFYYSTLVLIVGRFDHQFLTLEIPEGHVDPLELL